MMVRYEDYILDVNTTLNKMYAHFGEEPPASVYSALMDLMHSDKDGHGFSQARTNATASLYKWLEKNSDDTIEAMTDNCKDVLLELGYPLDVTSYRAFNDENGL